MGMLGIWQLLIVLAWVVGVGWPVATILRRMGFSGWWVILAFVPVVNLIGLWVLAFVDWPNADEVRGSAR